MKKISISLILIAIITLTVIACDMPNSNSVNYLRIHIRANSNSEEDQSVKYAVKQSVVEYLTPLVSQVTDYNSAITMLEKQKGEIEKVCNGVLKSNGFNYGCKVAVREELFPTRVYGDFTLNEGFYDALIVELGKAKGDNWWCVVYPPLCFTGSNQIKYKSKIYEIINNFKKGEL